MTNTALLRRFPLGRTVYVRMFGHWDRATVTDTRHATVTVRTMRGIDVRTHVSVVHRHLRIQEPLPR